MNITTKLKALTESPIAATAAIKNKTDYTWYVYSGNPFLLQFRGKDVRLTNGDKFGVRAATSKKGASRVVVEKLGVNRVITPDAHELELLLKKSSSGSASKDGATPSSDVIAANKAMFAAAETLYQLYSNAGSVGTETAKSLRRLSALASKLQARNLTPKDLQKFAAAVKGIARGEPLPKAALTAVKVALSSDDLVSLFLDSLPMTDSNKDSRPVDQWSDFFEDADMALDDAATVIDAIVAAANENVKAFSRILRGSATVIREEIESSAYVRKQLPSMFSEDD